MGHEWHIDVSAPLENLPAAQLVQNNATGSHVFGSAVWRGGLGFAYLPATHTMQSAILLPMVPMGSALPCGQFKHMPPTESENLPAAQSVHAAMPGLANLPATQAMQSAMLLPPAVSALPCGHVLQATAPAMSEKLPAAHFVHAAPGGANQPTTHIKQSSGLLAPAAADLPPGHIEQTGAAAGAQVPAAQPVHDAAPGIADLPAAQAMQSSGLPAPAAADLPPGHIWQLGAAARAQVPAAQLVQAVAPITVPPAVVPGVIVENLPAVQSPHAAAPLAANLPLEHGMHVIMKSSATSLNTKSVARPAMASAFTVIVSPTAYLWW